MDSLEMENNSRQSLWQFSDRLSLANLSLNDFAAAKLPNKRRNFDTRVAGKIATGYNPLRNPVNDGCNTGNTVAKGPSQLKEPLGLLSDVGSGDFNGFNFAWKLEGSGTAGVNLNDPNRFDDGWKVGGSQVNAPIDGGYSKAASSCWATRSSVTSRTWREERPTLRAASTGASWGRRAGADAEKNDNCNNNGNGFEGKESESEKRFKMNTM
ncbi:hypothetical protein BT93_D1360 [Corymbia citriodora subsp. variegata]|nr:hypothetical protein BT93_D1360 [Corymbia citriodora subsp. variegata]